MKLWLCSANAIDYEPVGLVVAKSEKRAIEKFDTSLEADGVWHSGTISASEVTDVDGYKVALVKDIGTLPKKPIIE